MRAREAAHLRDSVAVVPLHRVAQVAFGLTASAARKAVKRGEVEGTVAVGGVVKAKEIKQLLPHRGPIEERLERWNAGKKSWAKIRGAL